MTITAYVLYRHFQKKDGRLVLVYLTKDWKYSSCLAYAMPLSKSEAERYITIYNNEWKMALKEIRMFEAYY